MAGGGTPQGATFAFDVALRSLEEQLARIDALDSKAGILLATDGIIASLVMGRGTILSVAPTGIVLAIAAPVLLSLIAALVALLTQNYAIAPEPRHVAALVDAPTDWIRWRFLGNTLEAVDKNREKLRWKAQALTLGQFALLVGLTIFGGYFLVSRFIGAS